uniref:Uncharacterized protein n=1 Tax=viral metagenome TaxID=1070528 RepID=A0A6M3XJJ2_9ZZZZ
MNIMTEPNLYDMVVDELLERQRLVRAELRNRFKKTKPFRMEPLSNEEALYEYDTRGFEIFSDIVSKEGIDAAIAYRDRMENLKQRRIK